MINVIIKLVWNAINKFMLKCDKKKIKLILNWYQFSYFSLKVEWFLNYFVQLQYIKLFYEYKL